LADCLTKYKRKRIIKIILFFLQTLILLGKPKNILKHEFGKSFIFTYNVENWKN